MDHFVMARLFSWMMYGRVYPRVNLVDIANFCRRTSFCPLESLLPRVLIAKYLFVAKREKSGHSLLRPRAETLFRHGSLILCLGNCSNWTQLHAFIGCPFQ